MLAAVSLWVAMLGVVDEVAMARRAAALHERAVVIDAHAFSASRYLRSDGDPLGDSGAGPTDLVRLRAGGVTGSGLVVYEPDSSSKDPVGATHDALEKVSGLVKSYPDRASLALQASDFAAARRSGRVAYLLTLEGSAGLGGRIETLAALHAQGVRCVTPVYSRSNAWGAAVNEPQPRSTGLTEAGRKLVRELNRLGMIVDVSHASDRTAMEMVETSRAPVVASHSSARAISNIPENAPDTLVRAIAARGGVVMINLGSPYVNPGFGDRWRRISGLLNQRHGGDWAFYRSVMAEVDQAGRPEPATEEDVLRTIDHLVKVAGPDHVGLGSDLDGVGDLPQGLEDASKYGALTLGLLRRGYKDDDVLKFLGGNYLRVFQAVEKVAAGQGFAPPGPARAPTRPGFSSPR